MICRKQDDLAQSTSTGDSCQNCIESRRQGYHKNSSASPHSLFRSLWIKSSLQGDSSSMKLPSHQVHHHCTKAERTPPGDMELYEDINEQLKNWSEQEQEFYSEVAAAPSSPMDIWKKFDLGDCLPTPPSSPEHEPEPETQHSLDQFLLGERISTMCDLLDDHDHRIPALSKVPESCEKCAPLNTKLIQDCMWSATQPTLPDAVPKKTLSTKCSTKTDINSNSCATSNRNRTMSCSGDVPNSSECVDPTSVFPYPLSDTPARGGLVAAQSCMDTPSPSESEDDEEIDVVTVTVTRRSSRPSPSRSSSNSNSAMSSQVASMHNYSNTSTHTPSINGHHLDHHYSQPFSNSAPQSPSQGSQSGSSSHSHHSHSPSVSVLKRSRPVSMPCSPQPPSKRHRNMNVSDLKRACQKLYSNGHSSGRGHAGNGRSSGRSSGGSSRTSSDSEEGCGEGKRAQHNVLERKRRNDLKYSFCNLRAHVPEICQSERTPKVTILKKASDYITGLRKRQNALESEQARQKAKQENLKAKLAQLRRSDLSFL